MGLFWGIGVFAIKNGDFVDIALDDDRIISYIKSYSGKDAFVERRVYFVKMLIQQRKLNTRIRRINSTENMATLLLQILAAEHADSNLQGSADATII